MYAVFLGTAIATTTWGTATTVHSDTEPMLIVSCLRNAPTLCTLLHLLHAVTSVPPSVYALLNQCLHHYTSKVSSFWAGKLRPLLQLLILLILGMLAGKSLSAGTYSRHNLLYSGRQLILNYNSQIKHELISEWNMACWGSPPLQPLYRYESNLKKPLMLLLYSTR